jgi:imidazolonepropionase-like amidohydrolase
MSDLDLHGAMVADGSGSDPTVGSVRIRGGRFVGTEDVTPAAMSLDVTGCTVLPGLIDAHSHLGLVGNMDNPPAPWAVTAQQIFDTARIALDAGFTTVRDLGGLDGGMVEALRGPYLKGPRILPSGPIISEAGGNGDLYSPWSCCGGRYTQGLPGLSTVGAACRGPQDVREVARLSLRRGATQLKLSLNTLKALEETGGDTEFTLAEIRAAVEEARAKRTYVTAHATNSDGIRLGLAGGVECFEHGGIADEETARMVAAAGAPLVPTLTQAALFEQDESAPEHVRVHFGKFRKEMQESLLMASAHGVLVGLGSDLEGVVQIHRGSELTRRAALQSPMQALVAATSSNAKVLRRPDLGRITEGAVADVIVIAGDPFVEPELFDQPDRIVLVVQGGVVVKNLMG